MQLDAQNFLDLTEATHKLALWDTESTGLAGDYGSIICASVKPYGKPPITFAIEQVGNDRRVVRELADRLAEFEGWVTYYGKGHDVPLVNTRLVRWGLPPLVRRPHLDLYYVVKHRTKTGRRSQAHLLEFLEETMEEMGIEPATKMTLSPNVWADLARKFETNLRTLRRRCESDTVGLEALYRMTRRLVRDITR